MDAKIDYVSFTLPLNLSGVGHGDDVYAAIKKRIRMLVGKTLDPILKGDEWAIRDGRKHYGASLYHAASHAFLWWGNIANHVLVDLPGTACQILRDAGTLDTLIQRAADRLTRLDVAVDFPNSAVRPLGFVQGGYNERFKSRTSWTSETGDTEYVGAMSSARFARVYVYNAPHPRAGVMRVEHVLRDQNAKAGARVLGTEGIAVLVGQVGNSFGWAHPMWRLGAVTNGKLKAERHDTHGAGTLIWIQKTVRSALARALQDGLMSKDEFTEFVHGVLNDAEQKS